MHKISCYETLAQLIDICKSFFLIAFDYLTDFTNIVLGIIFPISRYLFHIYTGPLNFKTMFAFDRKKKVNKQKPVGDF